MPEEQGSSLHRLEYAIGIINIAGGAWFILDSYLEFGDSFFGYKNTDTIVLNHIRMPPPRNLECALGALALAMGLKKVMLDNLLDDSNNTKGPKPPRPPQGPIRPV